jgi:hypothetical protein
MHDPVRAQYPMASMTDALGRLVNVKQQEDTKSLLDYIKRFKQLCDVVKSQMGNKFLAEFIEHLPTYISAPTADQVLMKAEAYPKWMAYLLIRGSDQTKYGSLTKGFVSQYSLGNDQYPKTITTATDVLSDHKLDQRYWDNQKKNRDRSRDERNNNNNNEESGNATSFAQHEREMTCYCCGKKGHLSTTCDKRNAIPRDQWHVSKAMQHLQGDDGHADDDNNTEEVTDDDESLLTTRSTSSQNRRSGITRQPRKQSREMITWSGFQFQQEDSKQQSTSTFEHLKDVILLDTGSTLKATFMNPDLVTNIQTTRTPVSMTTNTGTKKI